MKKTVSYPELWRKKQRELAVKGNPDAEWLRMRSMLDQRMPVTGTIKKPFSLKTPKWGLHILAGISLVGAVYLGTRLNLSKKDNEPVKPGTQQIQGHSLAPAVNDPSPAPDVVKPSAGNKIQRNIPVIGSAVPHVGSQKKTNTNTSLKVGRNTIDSATAPAILQLPIHRDSSIEQLEASPLKPLRDSVAPVNLMKNSIQKDTSNSIKKPSKKKKRSKFSIFFRS